MVFHGKSNAFQIGKKLGLPKEIIDKALSNIDKSHTSIEELIKNIYDEKKLIDLKKEQIEKDFEEVENLKNYLNNDKNNLIQEQESILNKAKNEAKEILLSAKNEATYAIKNLTSNEIDSKVANNIRNKLNEKIKELDTSTSSLNTLTYTPLTENDIFEGLDVFIPKLQTSGSILSKKVNKNMEVLVQVGLAKMNLKLEELSLLNNKIKSSNKPKIKEGYVTSQKNIKSKAISAEINVIGENVDNAIYLIDKYLDNCSISNISPIHIIHGKGTGKLRNGIHSYLKKNPIVKSFRLGTFGEGEMGVTVVELK